MGQASACEILVSFTVRLTSQDNIPYTYIRVLLYVFRK